MRLLTRLGKAVDHLAWSALDGILAAGDQAGTLLLLAGTPLELCEWPAGHDGPVTGLAWHPYLHLLASGGADGRVRLWDGAAHPVTVEAGAPVRSLAWSPTGEDLAVAAGSRVLVVSPDGRRASSFALEPGPVSSVAWAPGPAPLAAGTPDGLVWLSPGEGERPVETWDAGCARMLAPDRPRHRLASADVDQVVRVTDLAVREQVAISGFGQRVHKLVWDRTGRRLAAAAGLDVTVWLLDGTEVRTREPIRLSHHDELISDLAYGGLAGTELATADAGGLVVRWPVHRLHDPDVSEVQAAVHCLAWMPNGAALVAGTADGSVWISDAVPACR